MTEIQHRTRATRREGGTLRELRRALRVCDVAAFQTLLPSLAAEDRRVILLDVCRTPGAPIEKLFEVLIQGDPSISALSSPLDVNAPLETSYNNTPLLAAALRANSSVIAAALRLGAHVNYQNKQGSTAFHKVLSRPLSAATDDEVDQCVHLLLTSGARIDIPNRHGDTPLHKAARQARARQLATTLDHVLAVHGRERLLDLLLSPNGDGHTPLHAAVAAGHATVVDTLLRYAGESTATLLHAADRNGRTPLHLAGDRRLRALHDPAAAVAVAERLIAAGAAVDARDAEGRTPLMAAVATGAGSVDYVELLLKRGANPSAADSHGTTPLAAAVESEAGYVADAIIRLTATCRGDTAIAALLSSIPIDTVYGRTQRTTLLHQLASVPEFSESLGAALRHCDSERVQRCLEAVDIGGRTPLHTAVAGTVDCEEAVAALLEAGANPAARDSAGDTPLDIAVRQFAIGSLALLGRRVSDSEARASVARAQRDRDGNTLLYRAAASGNVSTVEWLLAVLPANAIDASATDVGIAADDADSNDEKDSRPVIDGFNPGGTALHAAAEHGHVAVVRLLALHGADVNSRKQFYGNTPLHVAACCGQPKAVRALLDVGADRTLVNKADETPLAACELYASSNPACVECARILQL